MIDMIFTLFNSRTISNPLIKDSIETIQLKTRLSMSIFEVKYKSIKTLITLYWIKYLLALLSESNLQLILPSILLFPSPLNEICPWLILSYEQ